MPRFAANLSMEYAQVPFLDRFAAARKAGFKAVECQFQYAVAPEAIAAKAGAETGLHGTSELGFSL